VIRDDQPDAREGQAGRAGVAERLANAKPTDVCRFSGWQVLGQTRRRRKRRLGLVRITGNPVSPPDLVERFNEDTTLIGILREEVRSRGRRSSRVRGGKAEPGAKFADYFEFSEPLTKLPIGTIPCMPAEVGRGAIRVYCKGAARRGADF
jgi:hypothetical protein